MNEACSLADRACAACTPQTPRLSWPKTKRLLAEVPLWRHKRGAIVRYVRFPHYADAIAFLNKVAIIAEAEGHHPDIGIRDFNQVTLRLTTHAIHDLSENDFIMAAKIDKIA